MFLRIVSILLVCSLIGCGSSSRAPYSQAQSAVRVYVVERGDTLSHIAKRYYGNANKWPRLFEANREVIQDPDKIFPGQKIRIPILG